METKTRLDNKLANSLTIRYKSIAGDDILFQYRPKGLRCKGQINGIEQNWDHFTSGAVYDSPYLSVKNGIMKITDGTEEYSVDFTGSEPVWSR